MRKLIAAFNLTLDGFCDHTASIADEEIHQHYTDLLRTGDTILYGRITYQLMEDFWPSIVKNPTGNKSLDDFAVAIDDIEKIVFSNTLKEVQWESASLAKEDIRDVVLKLKQQPGKNIFAGSRTMITTLMNLGLVDEYQFCIQPIILGKGLNFYEDIKDRIDLNLISSHTFKSGIIQLCFEPTTREHSI